MKNTKDANGGSLHRACSDVAIKTPREILSDLQQLSRTCETPEDGVLKALKIIGGVQDASRRAALKEALEIIEDKCSWTEGEQRFFGGINVLEAHTEITMRVAAHQNAEVSEGGPLTHESPAAQSRPSLH